MSLFGFVKSVVIFSVIFGVMFVVGWPAVSGVLAGLGDMVGYSRPGEWWLSLTPLAALVVASWGTGKLR